MPIMVRMVRSTPISAERLCHGNGKPRTDAGGKSHHQKADSTGGTHACQGTGTQIASHDDRIYHAVQLLQNVAEHHGTAEA